MLPESSFDSTEFRLVDWFQKCDIPHYRASINVRNDGRATMAYCKRHFAWKKDDGTDLQLQHIPVVCLVLGGGPGSLTSVFEAVRAAIPLVLIKGSGRVVQLITEWRQQYLDLQNKNEEYVAEDQLKKAKTKWDEWKSQQLKKIFGHDEQKMRDKFDYISEHALVASFCPKTQASDELLHVIFNLLQENRNLTHESKLLLGLCGNDEAHVSALLREKELWKDKEESLNPDLLLFCANCDYGSILRLLIEHAYRATDIEALVKLEYEEKWGMFSKRNVENMPKDREEKFWGGRWDLFFKANPNQLARFVQDSHAREFLDLSTGKYENQFF